MARRLLKRSEMSSFESASFIDVHSAVFAASHRAKEPRSSPFEFAGRPVRIDGRPRVAEVAVSLDEGEIDPNLAAGLDRATRAVLATAWSNDARAEHASIAAFGRLSLQLLAMGAPDALVSAAHRAARDEVEHARLCFGLASSYLGAPVAPAPFPEAIAAIEPPSTASLAVETFEDGCVGEGAAAAIARLGWARATPPSVRNALARIARDEARHARLAWSIVRWCLLRDPTCFTALAEAASQSIEEPRSIERARAEAASHGHVSESERIAIVARARRRAAKSLGRG